MNKITILPATAAEKEWAAGVMAASEPWVTLGVSAADAGKAVNDPEYRVYIAHIDEQPAGLLITQNRGVAGSPYIKSIAVAPAFRGQGIGETMIRFSEDLFRPESKHLFLCVSSFNARAKAFYQRQGFSEVGEFNDYIIPGSSEILMHKRLK